MTSTPPKDFNITNITISPQFSPCFPGFCTSMGAAVTSPLAACGARAACEAMGGSTIDGAAAGDCATDSTDSTAAGEAATSMTLRTLSAFHRFQMFEGIGIQVQQSSTYFNISRQKHHETSTVLLFYSGFVNRISRYTYPSFPFMSIHFYLKESVKDAPCLLDTLQQVVDLATQTLHVFHLCGSCVCVCGWCENPHETGINWG